MKKFDLRRLMHKAWGMYRKSARKGASFSDCLRLAWRWLKCQASNRVRVEQAAAAAGYGDQVVHTWAGWRTLGREVIHTEKCVFQVVIEDPTTVKGVRTASYFTREQTFEPLAI